MKHLYSLLFFLVWGMLFSGKLCAQNAEWQYIKDGNKPVSYTHLRAHETGT